MNQLQKLQLVSLLEDGFTYNNSKEVRHLVGLSDQAYNFYNSLLSANKKLHSFYQSRELKRVNNNLNKFIDKQLQSTKTISLSRAFSGILAICCALFLSIGSAILEFVKLGAIQFTLMFGANSAASETVKPSTAAFADAIIA